MSGFASVALTALLAYLKLQGFMAISWLWVFAPIWLPPTIFAVLFTLAAVGAALVGMFTNDK